MPENRGAKAGWTWGGIGSIIWILILAIVLLVQGNYLGMVCSVAFFLAGILYVILVAPWKHPNTPFGLIYLGLLVIILAAAAVLIITWYPGQAAEFKNLRWLFFVLPLLIPIFIMGKKTWSQMHNE